MDWLNDGQWWANSFLESWPGIWMVGAVAVVLALLTHTVGVRGVKRLARPYLFAHTLTELLERPTRWLLVVSALDVTMSAAPDDLPLLAPLQRLSLLVTCALGTWAAASAIHAVRRTIEARHPTDGDDNLSARSIHTQARLLARCASALVIVIGLGVSLMTLPGVRQLGTSLLASAGVAGLVAGIAARPVLANLIAGLQIALSQPIRIGDVVVINGEWGRIEEITSSYVAMRVWDERRQIIPLQWLLENPFQNWTRSSSQILGTVFLWVDYRLPIEPLRGELERICRQSDDWDGRLCTVLVTDANERAMQIRLLVSSSDAGRNWNLRCAAREQMLAFIARDYPAYLPQVRAVLPTPDAAAHPLTHSASSAHDGRAHGDPLHGDSPHGDPSYAARSSMPSRLA